MNATAFGIAAALTEALPRVEPILSGLVLADFLADHRQFRLACEIYLRPKVTKTSPVSFVASEIDWVIRREERKREIGHWSFDPVRYGTVIDLRDTLAAWRQQQLEAA